MAESGKESDIYKLLDMYYMMRNVKPDWNKLHEIIDRYGLHKQIGYVLYCIDKLLGCEIPQWVKVPECEPIVVDPPTGRKFKWTVPLQERIGENARLRFLAEVRPNE